MLRGSPAAPRTTRASSSFGLLAAASDADVRRWIAILQGAGSLVETTTPEGYRVLEAEPRVPPPAIAPRRVGPAGVDDPVFELLRSWRRERALGDGVPAYVVFADATLREIAALRPGSPGELAGVTGVGPAKLERYGDEVLRLISDASR